MYKLVYFIRKIAVAIIFILIEIVAIHSYAHSTPYAQARLLSLSNRIVGGFQAALFSIDDYFSLKEQNRVLVSRIALLENRLEKVSAMVPDSTVHTQQMQQFTYMTANVVSNSVNRTNNFITLDKGYSDGVTVNMAVITPDGSAVGTVIRSSEHYSVARSLLSADMRVSGRLADDQSVGSVHWTGGDSQIAAFEEVSRYASIAPGDVVMAAGFSYFFPADVKIGVIESAVVSEKGTTYDATLRFSAQFSKLSSVLLIRNSGAEEIIELQQQEE